LRSVRSVKRMLSLRRMLPSCAVPRWWMEHDPLCPTFYSGPSRGARGALMLHSICGLLEHAGRKNRQ
jgi:hypothetical protein